LHDGVYEWIHSVTLGTTLDCRKWNVPIAVYCAYTFSYTQHSYGDTTSFYFINNSEYYDEVGNYLTLSVKIY
ncbi:MAG: hypothetical protein PUK48_04265, partial [Spirochaetales bacterium]|nr:hypothetical protein [Spirochaetales bacterium]